MSPGKRKAKKGDAQKRALATRGLSVAGKRTFKDMTAAHTREIPGAEFVEVMFLESARIYKVLKKNPKQADILKRLREAIEKRDIVRVRLDQPHGEVIADVETVG